MIRFMNVTFLGTKLQIKTHKYSGSILSIYNRNFIGNNILKVRRRFGLVFRRTFLIFASQILISIL
jgi:hypothetical protein